MRAAPQWLSDPGLKPVNATLSCGEGLQLQRVQCFSPHADPQFWGSSARYPTGPGWSGLGILVISLETTSAPFFQQVSGYCTEDLGCIPPFQCVLEAARPVSRSSHTFGKVLLRVASSKFLLLWKKEQLRKDLCRRGGVSSSPWTQLFHGKDKLSLEHDLKPWMSCSPGEHSHFFTLFHNLLKMLNVCKSSKVNEWKGQYIKSIK